MKVINCILLLCSVVYAQSESQAPYPPAAPHSQYQPAAVQSSQYAPQAPQPVYQPSTAPAQAEAYSHNSVSQYNSPEGFSVQGGYDGYLVPVEHSAPGLLTAASNLLAAGPGSWLAGPPPPFSAPTGLFGKGLFSLLPKVGLRVAAKVGLWLLGFAAIVLIGGSFTVALCTFTPICTLTFLGFGFSREQMRSYFTQDRLSSVTQFVMEAIDKYRQLQSKSKDKKFNSKKVEKTEKIEKSEK